MNLARRAAPPTDALAPPAHLAAYVDALGVDGAIRFLLEFGGAEVWLGVAPGARSRVARLLGAERAAALAALPLPRRVPLGKPWIARVWRERDGLPVAEIARRLHASDVTVRGWLKTAGPATPADPRQPRLL